MSERLTPEAIKAEALWLHDLRFGNSHCDRKYVETCPKFYDAIFEAGRQLRGEGDERTSGDPQ